MREEIVKKIFAMRSSIAISYSSGKMEFFKTNVRENIALQMPHNITDFLKKFNGRNTLESIISTSVFDEDSVIKLVKFLHSKNILIEINAQYDTDIYSAKYRLINFLEEYCLSTKDVLKSLQRIEESVVFIVGLGAVGSFIVDVLARCGVKHFILVDNDRVELSNLHRQNFYFENDVGRFKLDCIEERLKRIGNINVRKVYKIFDKHFFDDFHEDFSLAINCADFPSVDETTRILSTECMKRDIPHIVGGGYNLHLTLIGQSIIPHKTACHECFDTELSKINAMPNIKKLYRNNRKVGSFTPLCSLSASLSSIDAIKILCGFYDRLTNTSTRIEFKTRTMDIERLSIPINPLCACQSKE